MIKIIKLIILLIIFISACGKRVENPLSTAQQGSTSPIVVDIGDGLITREDSLADTFTIVLAKQPEVNVTIGPIVSSDTGEVTVSPSSVTFTTADWDLPQAITVTGVDDLLADGTQAVTISFGSTSSTDPKWNSLPIPGVTVYNLDNEILTSPGVLVSAGSSNLVTEGGATSSFEIALKSQPTANVTINVSVSDASEGTIIAPFAGSSGTLTFTTANWSTPQTVTVQGVDDAIMDGNQPFTVTLGTTASADPAYNGTFDPPDVNFINIDNDSAGVTVGAGSTMLVSENLNSSSFVVVLNSQPTANVTINVSVSDATEGTITTPIAGSSGTLTFTTANWSTPQTVTVQGVDDAIMDGNQPFTVTLGTTASADPAYNGTFNPPDVNFINIDNDSAGVTVAAGPTMLVSENLNSSSFAVVLNSQPTANVTINVSVSDPTEGTIIAPFAGSSGTITFTTANWSTPQTVTVQGVDDAIMDGNQPFTVILDAASSTDAYYNGIDPADVSFINIDNDSAGVTVAAGSTMLVSENLSTSSFTVVLNSQPTANVTINVSVSDATEGTITTPFAGTSGILTFTTANWSTPQTVTVQGVNDNEADGNQTFTVALGATASADPAYSGTFNPADITFINVDNDSAGITVNVGDGVITKEHPTSPLTDTFQVVLNSQPTADVYIGVTVGDPTEGTITTPFAGTSGTLTFTTANWNTPQTVTVQGVDDLLSDGMITYTITLAAATSTDPLYNGINPSDVTVRNLDNESLGSIVIVPDSNYVTSESGTSSSFNVFLSAQPAANVTIGGVGSIRSMDSTEGTITSPFIGTGTLVFSPTNWSIPQKIIVTGSANDGDVVDMNYQIDLGYATSTDPYWDGMYGGSIGFTNLNNYTTAFPAGYAWSVFTPGSDSFVPITGTNILFNNIPGSAYASEDEGYFKAPIGFHFHYLNNYYKEIIIYTNGLASFDTNIVETWNYNLFAAAASPFLVLAPWWCDLTFAGSSASVLYETAGTSPNRIFTVEWRNGMIVGDNERYTFQLKLYEMTNVVEFIYGGTSGTGGTTTAAVWGLKDNIGGADNTYIEAYDGSSTGGPFYYGDSFFPTNDYGVEGYTVTFTP